MTKFPWLCHGWCGQGEKSFFESGDIDRGATSVRNRLFFERVDIVIRTFCSKSWMRISKACLHLSGSSEKRPIIRSGRWILYGNRTPHPVADKTHFSKVRRSRTNSEFFVKLDDKGCWTGWMKSVKHDDYIRDSLQNFDFKRGCGQSWLFSVYDSLTKVIEYLLNDIYGKIKGNIVFEGPGMNIDSNSVRFFKDRTNLSPKNALRWTGYKSS